MTWVNRPSVFKDKIFECVLDFKDQTFVIKCEDKEVSRQNGQLKAKNYLSWGYCHKKGDYLTIVSQSYEP